MRETMAAIELKSWFDDDVVLYTSEDSCDVREALVEAVKKGVHLNGVNLRGADLAGAALSWSNLVGADLRGANLHGASLYGANLRAVDFTGAYLYGVDLRGADLLDSLPGRDNLGEGPILHWGS
jgi:uncharacterized protein YjbI with pentapeptide repeats